MFWGLLLLVTGVLFLLKNFGVISVYSFNAVWPIFLILFATYMIADAKGSSCLGCSSYLCGMGHEGKSKRKKK